jgi:hypothetical protein
MTFTALLPLLPARAGSRSLPALAGLVYEREVRPYFARAGNSGRWNLSRNAKRATARDRDALEEAS